MVENGDVIFSACRMGVSERRACAVVGQPRGTQRYEPREAGDEKRLVRRMKELTIVM